MNALEKEISESFELAFDSILAEVDENSFRHLNESVFRYAFIQALPKHIKKEDEGKRIDLLIHGETIERHNPIEFKFYDRRPLHRFNGKPPFRKGGPGKQNFKEFVHSCKTLLSLEKNGSMKEMGARFGDKYFILVAGDRKCQKCIDTFAEYYKSIERLNDRLGEHQIKAEMLCIKEVSLGDIEVFGWVVKLYRV